MVVFEVEVAARRWRGAGCGDGGARSKTNTLKHGTTTPDGQLSDMQRASEHQQVQPTGPRKCFNSLFSPPRLFPSWW